MAIEMTSVASSQIDAVGYDAETGTLFIEFKGGSTYSYADVPAEVAEQLLAAGSVGSFFAANIKGQYSFGKVG